MREIKGLNLFKERYGDEYPSIKDLIGLDPIEHKKEIYNYMRNARVIAAAPAIQKDCISGDIIHEELLVHTDGEYEWTSDITYYFDKYNYRLSDDFIQHVLDVKGIIS